MFDADCALDCGANARKTNARKTNARGASTIDGPRAYFYFVALN
jgi:hypothetical protein